MRYIMMRFYEKRLSVFKLRRVLLIEIRFFFVGSNCWFDIILFLIVLFICG